MASHFWRVCAAGVLLVCTAAVSPRAGSSLALLDVPTITGTVTTQGYTGWIQLQSYTFGVTNALKNAQAGKAAPTPLMFQKRVDATSPLFAQAYFSGRPFAGSTKLYALAQTAQKPEPTIEVELHDAIVVADTTATGSDGPFESLTLSYDAIRYCIPPAGTGQPICSTWNFKTNSSTYPAN